ncbi:MAG TPA: TrkA family potassium uptake protein [Spirochaetia bacterium]
MAKRFAVIGLGTFGTNLAIQLAQSGAEVLAIDQDPARLEDVKDHVTLAVRLDATDEKALESQRLTECDAVIIAMEASFETTLLCFSLLQQLAIHRIIVTASTSRHDRILMGLGVKETVLPEVEAAERLAGALILEAATEVFAVSSDYAIVEVPAPESFIGKDLATLNLPAVHHVTIVTIRRSRRQPGILGFGKRAVSEIVGIPRANTLIERGDVLFVFGSKRDIDAMLKG